jgi:hypothetical protein
MHTRATRVTFALLLSLPATGCLPDAVVWTPDGKSLLWTEDRGTRVVLYELASKERHVVEDNTDSQTTWPAISPDGKLIAVARAVRDGDQEATLQIVLLNRDGDEVKTSDEFPWQPADPKAKGKRTYATALVWSAAAKRIIVFSEGKTGIYDPDSNKLLPLANVVPVPLGNAAVRPDGKGFLALLTGGERTEIAFIGWDGKRQPIQLGDNELKATELVWDKDTARLIGAGGALDLDTAKLTATFRPEVKPSLLPADGDLKLIHAFPGGKAYVCVYEWVEKSTTSRDVAHQRLEVHRLSEKKRDILERRTRGVMTLFPSPDRKLVAVRYRPEGSARQVIVVIDANGKVMHEIDVKD